MGCNSFARKGVRKDAGGGVEDVGPLSFRWILAAVARHVGMELAGWTRILKRSCKLEFLFSERSIR